MRAEGSTSRKDFLMLLMFIDDIQCLTLQDNIFLYADDAAIFTRATYLVRIWTAWMMILQYYPIILEPISSLWTRIRLNICRIKTRCVWLLIMGNLPIESHFTYLLGYDFGQVTFLCQQRQVGEGFRTSGCFMKHYIFHKFILIFYMVNCVNGSPLQTLQNIELWRLFLVFLS